MHDYKPARLLSPLKVFWVLQAHKFILKRSLLSMFIKAKLLSGRFRDCGQSSSYMKKGKRKNYFYFMVETLFMTFVIEMMNFFSLLLHNRSVSFGVYLGHLFRAATCWEFTASLCSSPLCALRSNPIALQSLLDIYPACLFSVLITSQSILYLLFLYYYLSQYSLLVPTILNLDHHVPCHVF